MPSRYDDLDKDLSASRSDKQQSFFFFATIALAAVITIFGIAGGFIYGDYYGRKHAQYENPELRKYYAGECYAYIDNQLKKTIKTSIDKQSNKREQTERLEDIRNLIINLQMDMSGMGKASKKPKENNKKKVSSVASRGYP